MQTWIDFESVKRRVPITVALERYPIQGLKRSGKAHLRGRCPLHAGDGRETFHVDTAAHIFHCFSCGAGGSILDLVMAIEGCGLREAAERASAWRCQPTTYREPWQPTGKMTVTKKIELLPRLGFRLRGVDCHHGYLQSRAIHETTAVEFGVGFYQPVHK